MEINDLIEAWRSILDRQSTMQAQLDVHSVVIGNLLPAIQGDTTTVARIQAALEVASEQLASKSNPYQEAFAQESRRCLACLQLGAESLPQGG